MHEGFCWESLDCFCCKHQELPGFQELIFEDFCRFILVENIFEEVVLHSVMKDIMIGQFTALVFHIYISIRRRNCFKSEEFGLKAEEADTLGSFRFWCPCSIGAHLNENAGVLMFCLEYSVQKPLKYKNIFVPLD